MLYRHRIHFKVSAKENLFEFGELAAKAFPATPPAAKHDDTTSKGVTVAAAGKVTRQPRPLWSSCQNEIKAENAIKIIKKKPQ